MIFEIKNTFDFSILLILISILIIYFGKIIVKVRKIKKATILEEGVMGFSFAGLYILIPLLTIYYLMNFHFFETNWKLNLFWIGLVLVQLALLTTHKKQQKEKRIEVNWKLVIWRIILSIISIAITYYFWEINNLFYFITSLLFNIIILTLIAIKENQTIK